MRKKVVSIIANTIMNLMYNHMLKRGMAHEKKREEVIMELEKLNDNVLWDIMRTLDKMKHKKDN